MLKTLQHRRHFVRQQGFTSGDAKFASGFIVLARRLANRRHHFGQIVDVRQDILTRGGETHPPANFLKQRDSKLLLKLLDMKGYGGLGAAQFLRGAQKGSFFDNRFESDKASQIHISSLYRHSRIQNEKTFIFLNYQLRVLSASQEEKTRDTYPD
ncbi:conserved hypothetical protein [Klebsiella quasipneumoniae subsp. similipneumoniae]|nr:conserved hypothetical protein [Klebsiella quasipneumoniae subsp. similipneumoniae]